MKKQLFAALLTACAAAGARVWTHLHGFDFFPWLPLALIALCAAFFLFGRSLPARESITEDFASIFPFYSPLGATLAVFGAFLLFAAAALGFLATGPLPTTILFGVFLCLCGGAMLYVVFSLRKETEFSPVALLAPTCYLLVQLIFVYRENSRDPLLVEYYPAILAHAALCLAFLLLAAFAFRTGAPRNFSAVSSMAVLFTAMAVCDAVFARNLSAAAALLGFMLLLLAFLSAAEFDEA